MEKIQATRIEGTTMQTYSVHPCDPPEQVIQFLQEYCIHHDWDSMVDILQTAKIELVEVPDVNLGDADVYFYSDEVSRLEMAGLRNTFEELLEPFRVRRCTFLPSKEYGSRPKTNRQEFGANNCSFKQESTVEYDGLRFRTWEEVEVYKELKERELLFFPNAAAVFGGTTERREPDFLVCHRGLWGILEVNGGLTHTKLTSAEEHARARLFKRHGVLCVEFYDGSHCKSNPKRVVDDFLGILEQHGS